MQVRFHPALIRAAYLITELKQAREKYRVSTDPANFARVSADIEAEPGIGRRIVMYRAMI